MLWMCLLLCAASAVMALTARFFFPLIASHFPSAKLDLSIRLFYALLPIVLITGIATNCTAVLNTLDRFALPALAPITISIAIIVGALALGSRFGIWAMVYSTLAGSLLHAAIVGVMMHARGYRFHLRWYGMTEATREVGRHTARCCSAESSRPAACSSISPWPPCFRQAVSRLSSMPTASSAWRSRCLQALSPRPSFLTSRA